MTQPSTFEPEGRAVPFVDEGEGPVTLVLVTDVLIARFFEGLVGERSGKADWSRRLKAWLGRLRRGAASP